MILILIKLISLLVLLYFISRSFLPKTDLTGITAIPVHIFIGLIVLTYLYYWKLYFNLSIIFIQIIVFTGIVFLFFNKKAHSPVLKRNYNRYDIIALICAYSIVSLPIIIQSFYMAGGTYPHIFYNVDSAYFMQFVHAFIEKNQYPPEFKLSLSTGFNYHYGTMAAAAMVSELTGLQAHNSFLVVIPIIAALAFVSLTVEIFRAYNIRHEFIFAAIVLFGFAQYGLNYLHIVRTMKQFFGNEQYFYGQFTQIPSAFGQNFMLLALLACIRSGSSEFKILLVLLMGTVILYKLPYAPMLGMGVGSYGLYRFIQTKDIKILVAIIAGGILMIINYLLFVRNPAFKAVIEFKLFGLTQYWMFSYLLFSFSLLSLLYLFGSLKKEVGKYGILLFFIIPGLLIGSLINIPDPNALQFFWLIPFYFFLFVVLVISSKINDATVVWKKRLVFVAIVPFVILCLLVSSNFIAKLLTNKANGHEYCNNEELGSVLEQIPVKNSLIVTNDLRYPANNYKRDNRQFQLSALFGHSFFNGEMWYSRGMVSNENDRLGISKLLCKDNFNKNEVFKLCRRNGITHILIHKQYKHPENIPLPSIIETNEYIVYEVPFSNLFSDITKVE